MELSMVGILFVGFYEQNVSIIINTGVGVLVMQLPAVLERDYNVPMDPALTLWITSAAFFHAVGVIGLPGTGGFYGSIPWWDHFTHALSSSVVAAVGYATARSFDEHSAQVELPSRFMFVFILLFVMAFGVFWEVIEFAIGEVSGMVGASPILAQHGIEDTMLDLVFDTVGAVIVAIWGTAHLTDVIDGVSDYFGPEGTTRGE
jgi:hypothetical protein